MIVLKCNQPTYFDVDHTLVIPLRDHEEAPMSMTIQIPEHNCSIKVKPHRAHIDALKQHAGRGHTVIVWSAGGHAWAEAVVKALGLEPYVNLVIEKPRWAYDDLTPDEILHERIWKPDYE